METEEGMVMSSKQATSFHRKSGRVPEFQLGAALVAKQQQQQISTRPTSQAAMSETSARNKRQATRWASEAQAFDSPTSSALSTRTIEHRGMVQSDAVEVVYCTSVRLLVLLFLYGRGGPDSH
ncbi:unnamed protein product [Calypogeia fissa]